MKIRDLETPALVVMEKTMERNLDRMLSMLEGKHPRLRPHYKTHKSPYIAALQIAKGAKGITCSKLSEAEDLANYGIKDILIANQVVQPSKIAKMAHLAGRCHLTVCVDDADNLKAISDAACLAGTNLNVYVELEMGMNRCGVNDFESFCELAWLANSLPGVTYGGIQAYAGNLAHEYDRAYREKTTLGNEARLKELIAFLESRGIKSENVSGGSTGTSYLKAEDTVYTELQAGSFMFMDRAYRPMEVGFENALFVAATVISAGKGRFVIDAGIKSISPDQGPPQVLGWDYDDVSLSEEHTSFYGEHNFKVGDTVMVIPGHCCATVNLYDELYYSDGEEITACRPIVSRGKAQ